MQNKKKIVALAFLICFITVFLLSEAYILTNANHEHNHSGIDGNCAICVQIQNIENILKKIILFANNILLGLIGLIAIIILYAILFVIELYTLVNMKIQMNN